MAAAGAFGGRHADGPPATGPPRDSVNVPRRPAMRRGPAAMSAIRAAPLAAAMRAAVLLALVSVSPASAARSTSSHGRRALKSSPYDADLWRAALRGDIEAIRETLRNGADIEGRFGRFQETPLSVASLHGRLPAVQVLLDAGADINTVDNVGHTPLYLASQQGHLQVAQVLLDAGADVDRATDKGTTPLSIASERGRSDVVGALLGKGADPNAGNSFGVAPLHKACVTIGGASDAIVKSLLDAGANLEAREEVGRTPLMWAARFGNVGAVQLLAQRGADLGARDFEGRTAVDWICDCQTDSGVVGKLQCPAGGCEVFGRKETIAGLLA